MAVAAAIFLIFLAMLIIFSLIFDFWGYLIVVGLIVFGVILLIAFLKRDDDTIYTPSYRSYSSYPGTSSFLKSDRQRSELRNKISDEWDRQSSFGSAEDLR